MLRTAIEAYTYSVQPEQGQNPYIGFMSFQHFADENLYSDMIVDRRRGMTETEHYECYPIPSYVEQNGRAQGYYPATSVAYIRILWKEFEPVQGEYNYPFIEDIIKKTKAHGQTLIFRLMAHSTRACDDVPDWLKELIPCPARPDGKRVKDSPTDPLFLELFSKAIRKIGERFDSDPTLDAVDISLPGAWGEGHNLHLYSEEALTALVDTYIDAFKQTRLIGQIGRPELLQYAKQKALIGWRGDGLGEPRHLREVYPPRVEQVADLWKTAPVSFESYWWLGEWQRQGWDIDEIIDFTLRCHISSFNGKSFPCPTEWQDKIDHWVSRMGYHYAINIFRCPSKAAPANDIACELTVENIGVAPIYHRLPLMIKLIGSTASYEFDTDVDITRWLPGTATENIRITLPPDIKEGDYTISVGITDPHAGTLYFCTDAVRQDGYYVVGHLQIEKEIQ